MATRTTYLLLSGVEDVEALEDLPLISANKFERQKTFRSSEEGWKAVRFAVEQPLEETADLTSEAKALSRELPEATVLLCEVEERFDQIDAIRAMAFVNGQNAGEIEHGHVFNVGGR